MSLNSAAEKRAHANLEKFIKRAQLANPFGDMPWGDVSWCVRAKARSSSGTRNERIWFTQNFVKKVTPANAIPFPEYIDDFVKAYACHYERRGDHGVAKNKHMLNVRAFRYLVAAVGSGLRSLCVLIPMNFDNAANLCLAREEEGSAYRLGGSLQEIAKQMDKLGLTATKLNWKNPIPRESSQGGTSHTKVGRKFDENRRKKLPKNEIIDALANISNRVDLEGRDILRQRAMELIMCGGFRPCEVLTLTADCLTSEVQLDEYGKPLLDRFGKPLTRCGIRYVPAKRGHEETQIKWLPSVMVDVAKRAISDILKLTRPFRDIAEFMYKNAERTLLPEPWHSLPDEALISTKDISAITGVGGKNPNKSVWNFIEGASLTKVPNIVQGRVVPSLVKWELERYLRSRSGEETVFPAGQASYLLHECLFVVGINYIGSVRPTLKGTAVLLTDGQLRDYILTRDGTKSIFERLGYLDAAGSPLKMNAYQLRHWLNTLANEGGMSQIEIARWFGRKDVSQNSTYNHMTGVQLAARLHERRRRGEVKGAVTEAAQKIKDPIRREEFVASTSITVHETDIGVCEHNWAALPCPKAAECGACDELTLEKGNKAHKQRAIVLRDRTEMYIQLAEKEVQEGTVGADNWLESQKLMNRRAKDIIKVHEDDSIPDGTYVELSAAIGRGDEKSRA